MSDFERDILPSLELASRTVEQLRDQLADVLIRKGKPDEYSDVYPAGDGSTPYDFSYPLDVEFLKSTFFPNDTDVVIEGGQASYFTTHKLEENDPDDAEVEHGIDIDIKAHLVDPKLSSGGQVVMEVTMKLGGASYDGSLAGYTETEYSQNGTRISPNNLKPVSSSSLSQSEMEEILLDKMALRHKLTLEDGEKLAKIVDYIEAHPRID